MLLRVLPHIMKKMYTAKIDHTVLLDHLCDFFGDTDFVRHVGFKSVRKESVRHLFLRV